MLLDMGLHLRHGIDSIGLSALQVFPTLYQAWREAGSRQNISSCFIQLARIPQKHRHKGFTS
jgi:hypothetical protein